ncbi:kinase-like protein [Canariomyces notabilis]|uniref:Kinase-like protein n=1 Tax=Canariomyces notabilis TaxID=2074819 RepID=A0AAN6TJI7_9PEZI|nr:kinase-like protein [Canariomyces arenarius]
MRDYDDFKEFDICKGMHSIMLDELRALERIAQNPHPNIIRYHGCRVRRGRITGIVLDRYEKNLDQYIQRVGPLVDKAPFMDALEDAVRHLHSLGLAHNDINLSNIMVNDAGMPVLVDFGSCKWIGARLGPSGGTPGFAENDGEFDTSEASHDPFGLVKIREWLDNPVPMGRDDPGLRTIRRPWTSLYL